ncbi:polymer-forming cytoskeletal protein [Methylocystis sp. MJC1]|jgi:cytoskeletal protein CcmA (bactofilin family)|uniref:bactofilin family protein n=1 Tax=Methylocystis sp. MJC1 TaxID=2654282 RepID=UPI0013E9D6C8|nr:polymer-forming cytoskeletal protein [Methylocystis sp. MJC1]KAF2992574.1 hypothetical protein MJC1_00152 [Methylocystis sp. MJC1]MBU6526542.1 polymer-forming cytoskeletal protein [Methylocystis sp. MJC1]UZX12986.1 polymer-forming cytoskeletal protein [Methylocystis sp. MJC1]
MAANAIAGFRPEQENVVYIGAGVTVKGEFSVPDLLVVDGVVEGDVTARGVVVGQSGVIRGHVAAEEADVSGSISDHVEISELLTVRSTGRVEGRVIYREMELEKGAVVTGDLSAMNEERAVARPTPAAKIVPQARAEPVAVAPVGKTSASLERLSEAARAARKSAAKSVASEIAAERRNVLRAPMSSRKGRG